MSKKVLIIGAGLAGLSAGISLAAEGIHVEIYDLSPSAGGMCHAWNRKGYRFDGCIQWMSGTRGDDPSYGLYQEVGALGGDTAVYCPHYVAVELDGAVYDVPMDIGEFRDFLHGLSEEDSTAVEELCRDIDTMAAARLLPGETAGLPGLLSRLRGGHGVEALWGRTAGRTVGEYVAVFKSPRIARILKRLVPEEYSVYTLLTMLGARMSGNAGYPLGGSAAVIDRMTKKFTSLGGVLRLGTRVDEIISAGGVAGGIRRSGDAVKADGVIAACDVHDVLEHLLRRRYQHPQLARLFKTAPLFEPLSVVSFGLCKQFGIPYTLTCECPEGMNVAPGVRRYGYALRSFDFDPSAAPPGCSSVMALFETPLDYWRTARDKNPDSYKVQKELLAEQVAKKIEKRYPGFRDAIEIVDVATPATYARLTNVYRGSFEGFAPTPEVLKAAVRKTLPGLRRFCLCGQWTAAGGGIGAAVAGGRQAARIMRRELR